MKWLVHKLQERRKFNKWKTVFLANFSDNIGGIHGIQVRFNQYKQRYKFDYIPPDNRHLTFDVNELDKIVESAKGLLIGYCSFSDVFQFWNTVERSKRDNIELSNHLYPPSQD